MDDLGQTLRFDDRVALVTGAGRGMGRSHALMLAERGAKVVVSDVGTDMYGKGADQGPATDVVEIIRATGGRSVAYFGDLTTENGARSAVRAALDTYGRIDVIVHNAGFGNEGAPLEATTLDQLERQLAINALAAYALALEAWPVMQAQHYGRVVVTGSTAHYGVPLAIPYSVAKASYVGLVRALAGPGDSYNIKVNLVAPSAATRLSGTMPESGFRTWFLETMKPELVSPVVTFLSHEECTVTGELFVVGGGRFARTVLAETQGYVNSELTPEHVQRHLGEVMADQNFEFPRDTMESLNLAARSLGYEVQSGAAIVAVEDMLTDEVDAVLMEDDET